MGDCLPLGGTEKVMFKFVGVLAISKDNFPSKRKQMIV